MQNFQSIAIIANSLIIYSIGRFIQIPKSNIENIFT